MRLGLSAGRFSMPYTLHPVPSTQYPVPSTQYPVPSLSVDAELVLELLEGHAFCLWIQEQHDEELQDHHG